MDRNILKYILDAGLLVSFLGVALTGIFKFKGFREFFGISLSYRDPPMPWISTIHDWSGVVMAVIVLIHLILNWEWIVSVTREIFLERKK